MNARTSSHPAAYLRRSYVDPNSPGDISREAQREAVRRLATAEGHNGNLVEYDDWGVSADIANSGKRIDYNRLLADMEAGRVSSVYAFDVDRLYRDPRDLIRLQDAAQRHQVRIVTTAGELAIGDGADPAAEGFAFMGAVFGRMELQKIKKRNRAARDARIARGDTLGRPAYGYQQVRDAEGRIVHALNPDEPLEPIIEAFREAGSFAGAARLLNSRNVPSPRGGRWAGNVVARVIRRNAPGELAGRRVEPRVRVRGTFTLSRLLRCSCGQVMTGRRTTHPRGNRSYQYVSYVCFRGRYDADHGRYIVSERVVLPFVQAEVARLGQHAPVDIGRAETVQRIEALREQRERLGWAVTDGLLTRDQARDKAAEIDAEIDGIELDEQIVDIPQIDADAWEKWSPRDLNAILTLIFDRIQLDADLQPVEAVWRRPEWRSDV